MDLHEQARRLGELQALDQVASPLARKAKELIAPGPVKDVLSGTGLGHPLHPVLTDIPIGLFTSATVLDLLAGRRARGAVNADWSDTQGTEQRVGVVHAAANVTGTCLFAASLLNRLRGRRYRGRVQGLLGMATLAAGGYLGGFLSYGRGVGVNNAFFQPELDEWTAVADESELHPGAAVMKEAGGATILLYRSGGRIHAIGSRCTHAGGPLHEGKIDDSTLCVECPWHGSVFSLEDGTVVHGPASVPEAAYEVRTTAGRIEVRASAPRA
jgi:nitrite reductase/ring-hydroxylating ferredoxin subunit/uncharacterized membrane protein